MPEIHKQLIQIQRAQMLGMAMGLMEILDIGYQLIDVWTVPLISALLASLITVRYVFGIRKLKRETIIIGQIDLYTSLMMYLHNIPDKLHDTSEKNLNSLASEFHEIYDKMLLFSPDHIIKKTISALDEIRKDAEVIPLGDLIITLRKEFIPNTTLKPDDVLTLKFQA